MQAREPYGIFHSKKRTLSHIVLRNIPTSHTKHGEKAMPTSEHVFSIVFVFFWGQRCVPPPQCPFPPTMHLNLKARTCHQYFSARLLSDYQASKSFKVARYLQTAWKPDIQGMLQTRMLSTCVQILGVPLVPILVSRPHQNVAQSTLNRSQKKVLPCCNSHSRSFPNRKLEP